jgi:hypothetical protein
MAVQTEVVAVPASARAPAVDVDEVLQSQAARHAAAVKARPPKPPAPFICNRAALQTLASQHAVAVEEAVKRAEQAHAADVDRLNAEASATELPAAAFPLHTATQISRLNGERLALERENIRLKEQVAAVFARYSRQIGLSWLSCCPDAACR